MRKSILLLGSLLFVSVLASADEWNKSFKVSATPELRLNARDGSIDLSSWDQKEIQVRVETVGWRIAPGQIQIVERQVGDRVEVEVQMPEWHWGFSVGHRSVRVFAKVPRQSNLDINTGDGSIHGSELQGDLRIHTGDGGIDLDRVDGKLNANTGDGHVHVSGRFDELQVRTGDGSIRAVAEHGSKVSSAWSFNTGDGSVELRLPEDLAADLDARTGDGNIDVDFPVLVTGSIRHDHMRGKVNGGGPPLEIHTGDGSIRLSRL